MNGKILIIGSLNMDMVIQLNEMPKIGETLMAKTLSYVPGGKGANQAFAAGKLGGKAMMLGCVGDDAFGQVLLDNLAKSDTDISGICKCSDNPTGTAVIYVDENGDNSIVVVSGANGSCDVEYLKQHDDWIKDAEYVILQMEIPFEAVFYAVRRASELGKKVILNPAPAPMPDVIPDDIWRKTDYITPNETELLKLSGETVMDMEHIYSGVRRLHQKGVRNILVTLGDKGVLFSDGQSERLFPTRKVDAVDTTAAGDCFNAAFAVGLSEGMTQEQAIAFANTASSIAVTRKGAQSSIPDRDEVSRVQNGNGISC